MIQEKTENFISKFKPDVIINCAGKVGGILLNVENPVNVFEVNTLIQLNLIKAAYKSNVPYFIYLEVHVFTQNIQNSPLKKSIYYQINRSQQMKGMHFQKF